MVDAVSFSLLYYQGWEFAHGFSEPIARFLPKNERMSDSLILSFFGERRSLISSEQPEQITHSCSFLVSDLSDSLTSLIFGERPE